MFCNLDLSFKSITSKYGGLGAQAVSIQEIQKLLPPPLTVLAMLVESCHAVAGLSRLLVLQWGSQTQLLFTNLFPHNKSKIALKPRV